MRYLMVVAMASGLVIAGAPPIDGQAPAADQAARLREVLPAGVATRVLAVIARARSHDLPTDALENRALKFAARGVAPDAIERSVVEHEARMEAVNDVLRRVRGRRPADDEVEAGAEVMRKGVNGARLGELAKSVTSERSLAVPLYVLGDLVDRGLASDDALRRVEDRLRARATDHDLEQMPASVRGAGASSGSNRPAQTGRDLAETKRPGSAAGSGQGGGSAGGPPPGVPANGGGKAKPTPPRGRGGKPITPPGKRP